MSGIPMYPGQWGESRAGVYVGNLWEEGSASL